MIKVLISGCNGRMGHVVEAICATQPQILVVGGFDVLGSGERAFPIFATPDTCTVVGDVVIDFSSPAALPALLAYGTDTQTPLVLATTGYSEEQLTEIDNAAQTVPIFRSANMSLGVNLLMDLVERAAQLLGHDYDIEIVERHHNKKVDSPSGTALMLADAARDGLSFQPKYVYERQSVRTQRGRQEIGISAVRGGTIVGDHEVIFAGRDEVIELHHHAASREIFAQGAVKAAQFLAAVTAPGLYNMGHLLAH